ncbi:TetR/AcrR family transcriptional regulator [Paenibacillus paeoniae]|uniref:TetR/AcrR family transcriptional regulator n=1 Tax=Paenibacillus paeoniae TaxID=2292705 RepID=A0A371PGB3_9BACL|nr:TetR/AcrR family transcriptional regulator [Paenibacillus paeoniae]REK74972.1 TetR/AcrR family transcriptional regulator [Paenibacillus paeoniae]
MSQTKERILHTATELFNASGTGPVSTNHIADAAGISPGNLYYHYPNKAAIIRSIMEAMYTDWDAVWELPSDREASLADLHIKLHDNFKLLWHYRFFYREAIALFQQDEELKNRHIAMTKQRFLDQGAFAKRFIASGVLHSFRDDAHIEETLTVCWMIAMNWLSFLEMNGMEVTEQQFAKGVSLIERLLEPHFTLEKGDHNDG